MNPKDKKIIEDSERAGIPIFVLTAKDFNSVFTIEDYLYRCELTNCPEEHKKGILVRIKEFKDWMAANKNKVKLPD